MYDEEIQHIFTTKINSWVPMRAPYHMAFDKEERERLVSTRNQFRKNERTVLFLSFENRFAACGGLAAVTRYLPEQLALSGEQVFIISPLHRNHAAIKQALDRGHIQADFEDFPVQTGDFVQKVSCYRDRSPNVTTLFIAVDGFFQARNDPYDYPDDNLLLMDSLLFAAVLPSVLKKVGLTDHLIIHANDWETALVAVSSKKAVSWGILKHAYTILTLHNSFDSHLPENLALQYLGVRPLGATVLQSSIPFMDSPLTTVSAAFACELRNDPIQSKLFAPHLQHGFSLNPPVGIENGLFGAGSQVKEQKKILSLEQQLSALIKEKQQNRKKIDHFLLSPPGKPVYGTLKLDRRRRGVPIFFMSGRLDLMQKGFDVIFHAFRRLPAGKAKLVFTPSNPQNGNQEHLSFFIDICEQCDGDITIWPFRLEEKAYHQCLSGSSFLIMPSFYEPFGAATEGFLHGTPVIARATGGLIGQVVSAQTIPLPVFYGDFSRKSSTEAKPNGILYREQGTFEDVSEQWKKILSLPVNYRIEIPLYLSMVDAALEALQNAVAVYNNSVEYAWLIKNGKDSLHRFNWARSVEKYRTVYDLAAEGR